MNDDRRRYRRAYVRLWKNMEFRALPDAEKVMTTYILFGPQSNRLGLFAVSFGAGAEDLNWSPRLFALRLATVCRVFGWSFDMTARVVWIPSWWDFNDVRENFKVMQGALADIHEVPECPLIDKFLSHLTFVPTGLHYLFEGLSRKRAIPRNNSDSGIQEQDQEQKQEQEQERGSSAASAEPSLLDFPTVGMNGTSWSLTSLHVSEWSAAFPSIDILAEAKKALAWLHANPGRRKTSKGMPKFFVGWFSRANDSRGGRAAPAAARPIGRMPQNGLGVRQQVPDDEAL